MRENGKKKVDGAASEQPENKQNKQTPKKKQESPKTPKTKGKGDPSGEELLKTKLQDDVELSPEIIGKFEEFGIKNIKDATVGDLIRAQVELSGYTMDGVQIAFTKVPGYYEKLKKYVFNDEEYEEGAIIWIPLPHKVTQDGKLFSYRIDFDILSEQFGVELEPIKTTVFKSEDDEYVAIIPPTGYLAMGSLKASEYHECGICIFCKEGKFKIACQGFYLTATKEEVLVPFIYNSYGSTVSHHRAVGVLVDIGVLTLNAILRYVPNNIYDWYSRVHAESEKMQEIASDYTLDCDPTMLDPDKFKGYYYGDDEEDDDDDY